MLFFWVLNKLAESLKGRWEDRVKPYMFAGPAILAIGVYLIYPAIETFLYSFANDGQHRVRRLRQLHRPAARRRVP